jgi:hypothetical protein
MDSFEKLVMSKADKGEAVWLARRLIQCHRANIELATANEALQASNEALRSENETAQARLAIANRPRPRRGSR